MGDGCRFQPLIFQGVWFTSDGPSTSKGGSSFRAELVVFLTKGTWVAGAQPLEMAKKKGVTGLTFHLYKCRFGWIFQHIREDGR